MLFTFFKAYYLKQIIVRMVSLESSANGIIKLTFYFTYPEPWFLFNYRISWHWSPSILSENIRELLLFSCFQEIKRTMAWNGSTESFFFNVYIDSLPWNTILNISRNFSSKLNLILLHEKNVLREIFPKYLA